MSKTHLNTVVANIVVAGGGAFGTALAIVMSASKNAHVTLLMRNPQNVEQAQATRCNQARLPVWFRQVLRNILQNWQRRICHPMLFL